MIDRQLGHTDAEEHDPPGVRRWAEEFDYDKKRLEEILVEVAEVFDLDRGRELDLMAFPELNTDP